MRLLGTVIEQNGDGCLEDSLMPVGWPFHLDGAVKKDASIAPQHAVFGDFTGIWLYLDGWKAQQKGCGNLHSRACCSHVLRFVHESGKVATTSCS